MNNNISTQDGSRSIVVDLSGVAFGGSIAAIAVFAPAYWPLLFFWLLPFAMRESAKPKPAPKKWDKADIMRLWGDSRGRWGIKDDDIR